MTVLSNIENRLKLRHLALIVAINDLGSLRRAAESLSITQPAATSALKELEGSVGARLFERTRSGAEPTLLGSLFVERSRLILTNVRATAQEVLHFKNGDLGEVSIGTLAGPALTLVPTAIAALRSRKPKISLYLVEGTYVQLMPALHRGELDLVVGRIPLSEIGRDFEHETLGTELNAIVCGPQHPLARKRKVLPADMTGYDWILPVEGSHVRSEFSRAFRQSGLPIPQPALVTSSTTTRMQLLATTDMLAVLADGAAHILAKRGLCKILDVGIDKRASPIELVTRADRILTPPVQLFVKLLHEAAKAS